MKVCPICRKTTLEGEQIICPKCKADSPFTLLEGYSPVKKISDELKKIDSYKDQIKKLRIYLYGLIVLLVFSLAYTFIILPLITEDNEHDGTSVIAVENPLNGKLQIQVDSLESLLKKQNATMEELQSVQVEPQNKDNDLESSKNEELKQEVKKLKAEQSILNQSNDTYKATIKELESERDELQKSMVQLKAAKKDHSQSGSGATAITHIVQEGESLFSIARKYFGNGMKYEKIAADNNIADPGSITKGQELLINK